MGAALALAARARGTTAPNPGVGCVIFKDGVVVGRGWTQPGGRPHAEAMALDQAGDAARGADVYVTLEPCAHDSERGPACAALLAAAAPARVVAAIEDPDPRTSGQGFAALREAGIEVITGICAADARAEHAGFLSRVTLGRPRVTLKTAMSLDGRTALSSGESQWITGPDARRTGHQMRAEADAIMVGRGTWEADEPSLDCRIAGAEDLSPVPLLISATMREVPERIAARGGQLLRQVGELAGLPYNDILVEGGAGLAGTLLAADLIDRLAVFRAPILIGDGAPGLGRVGLEELSLAHGRWHLASERAIGVDRLEIYERTR